MAEDLVAIPKIAPAPAAGDYEAICAALMQTERGRWFLEEYALRNRSADTKQLLSAIERIEAAVCTEQSRQAQSNFRTDLMEMAKAITRTRAEVAAIKPEAQAAAPRQPPDVFAAAERIRDVTWAMRGHGFDPSTCAQLEELAGTILSASALRDPTDHRAHKLGEVLHYLEHRIAGLLDSCEESPPAPDDDHTANGNGFAPVPAAKARNGSVGPLVMPEGPSDENPEGPSDENAGPDAESSQIRIQSFLAVHDDLGDDPLPAAIALPTLAATVAANPLDPPISTTVPPPQTEALNTIETPGDPVFAEPLAPPCADGDPRINGATLPEPMAILPEIALPDFGAPAHDALPLPEPSPLPELIVPEPAPPAAAPLMQAGAASSHPAPTAQSVRPQSLPADPLAALKAMSEDELVALFT